MADKPFEKEQILNKIKEDSMNGNVFNNKNIARETYKEVSDILNVVEQITETENFEDLKILLSHLIISGSLKVNSSKNQNKHVKDYLFPTTLNEYEDRKIDTSDIRKGVNL